MTSIEQIASDRTDVAGAGPLSDEEVGRIDGYWRAEVIRRGEAPQRGGKRRRWRILVGGCLFITGSFLFAPPALAHEGEQGTPAVTDVQEAIAILATHQGSFPQAEVVDQALDKVKDSQTADNTRGVDLGLVRQAQSSLAAERLDEALTLLERSVGACPGAPVIDPDSAPRTPPSLASPCPSPAASLLALSSSPVHGAQEATFLVLGGMLIFGGLALARRIR